MQCRECGSELNLDGTCPRCEHVRVRVMDAAEKDMYDGITLDENGRQQRPQDKKRGHVFRLKIKGPWWSKLLTIGTVIGILLVLAVVFVPVAVAGVLILIIGGILYQLFKF